MLTAGRIFGWLIVCNPSYQTAAEIQSALKVSKGSVSSSLNLLARYHLVRRIGIPESRSRYYQAQHNIHGGVVWAKVFWIRSFIELLQKGMKAVGNAELETYRRLQEMRDGYIYLEKEMTELADRIQKFGGVLEKATIENTGFDTPWR